MVGEKDEKVQASVFLEEKGELHALTRKGLSWDDYQSAVTVKMDPVFLFIDDSPDKQNRTLFTLFISV